MHDIDAYLIQETWRSGNYTQKINDMLFIHHGLSHQVCSRGSRGVGISLEPCLQKAYKEAGSSPPLTTPSDTMNLLSGQYLVIKLSIIQTFKLIYGAFCKGEIKQKLVCLTLVAAYYPDKTKANGVICAFMHDTIRDLKKEKQFLLIAQDSNAKMGIQISNINMEDDSLSTSVLGTYGLPETNKKGMKLL